MASSPSHFLTFSPLPVVRPERAYWQAVAVQVAVNPVLEGVAYGYGMWHGFASDIHFASLYPCFRRVEHTVFAGHFKVFTLQAVASVHPHVGPVETYYGRIVLESDITEVRAFRCYAFYSVCLVEREQGKAQSGQVLLARVDTVFQSGIKEHGLGGFLKEELFPAGVPWPIYIILTPVQLLELVLIRPISLTVRLFANMVAGHLLVATCYAFTQFYLIESAGAAVKVGGALWLCGGLVFTCFEMFVAALQAYVFAILATVYINQSYPEAE